MGHAMVVAPQSEPADIALEILASGGNAFDAAIAGAFAQGVVDGHRSGLGGFGAATLYSAREAKVFSVNFFGTAGSLAHPSIFADKFEKPADDGFGFVVKNKINDVGYQSITVPGMVAGLGSIHQKFGRLPWSELLQGPASLAQRGFLVGPQLANFWRRPGLFGRVSTGDRLGFTAEGQRLWLKNGSPPREGDIVRQEELAATYTRLGQAGAADFYRGEIGKKIAQDFSTHDALITKDDIISYSPDWHEPIKSEVLGHDLYSTPLPGGGLALIQALKLAELTGLLALRPGTTPFVETLAHILSAVQDDRTRFHADPNFQTVDTQNLLSTTYLNEIMQKRKRLISLESPDTTEIVVVDAESNGIVLSHSLGYGSGVFTPGLGFMYNNCMSGFDPRPGQPGSVEPGKARSTAIAQTILMSGEKPRLFIGSPGGSHITAGIAQALLGHIHYGYDLQDAVCRPRIDAYGKTLLLESRMPYNLEDTLKQPWNIKRSPSPFGQVGRVYAIAVTEAGLRPGYDPGEPATVRELVQ